MKEDENSQQERKAMDTEFSEITSFHATTFCEIQRLLDSMLGFKVLLPHCDTRFPKTRIAFTMQAIWVTNLILNTVFYCRNNFQCLQVMFLIDFALIESDSEPQIHQIQRKITRISTSGFVLV